MSAHTVDNPYATEEALCEAFAGAARADGWTVYPEQGGWDLLLVRRAVQVGVQAKLVAGVEVLLQALPTLDGYVPTYRRREGPEEGPNYRAVLVSRFPGRTPRAEVHRRAEIYALARHLRLVVLEPPDPPFRTSEGWLRVGWNDNLSRSILSPYGSSLDFRAYRWRPEKPIWTPPFVPDLPAGVPNPRSVGKWQLAAVRLELLAEERGGWVCLDDARAATAAEGGEWNPKTLLSRYYDCTGELVDGSRQARWRPRPRSRASREFPEVYDELRR